MIVGEGQVGVHVQWMKRSRLVRAAQPGTNSSGVFPLAMLATAVAALSLVCACGPVSGEPPEFVGLEDHVAFVGEELFFEIRATDAEIAQLRFSAGSVAPSSNGMTLVPAGNGTSALFRWTPTAPDIGEWLIDFTVSDGINETIESIFIEVLPTIGEAPRFLKPLGAGTTLDVTESACLTLTIAVDDADSATVQVTEEAPLIAGATLTEDNSNWLWEWCPSKDQIGSGDSFALHLAADDGQHRTLKHFVIVLRNTDIILPVDVGGFTLNQAGSTCEFILPEPLEIGRGTALIIARDSAKAEFETHWGVTLPPGTTFINSQDQCPRINGDESFVLQDSGGSIIDGPTPILVAHENFQRVAPSNAPGERGSWTIASDATANASPGRTPSGEGSVFISEFSDADGSGNFIYEFVEIGVN